MLLRLALARNPVVTVLRTTVVRTVRRTVRRPYAGYTGSGRPTVGPRSGASARLDSYGYFHATVGLSRTKRSNVAISRTRPLPWPHEPRDDISECWGTQSTPRCVFPNNKAEKCHPRLSRYRVVPVAHWPSPADTTSTHRHNGAARTR